MTQLFASLKWSLCTMTYREIVGWRNPYQVISNHMPQHMDKLSLRIVANAMQLLNPDLACWSYLHWYFLTTDSPRAVTGCYANSWFLLVPVLFFIAKTKDAMSGKNVFTSFALYSKKRWVKPLNCLKAVVFSDPDYSFSLGWLWTMTWRWRFSLALPKCFTLWFS
jgi:hypothetical protein